MASTDVSRGETSQTPSALGVEVRPPGRESPERSYFARATFEDPDGNGWLLQEITTRLPGREWED